MAQSVGSYTNPLKKFKLVFLGEQSGMPTLITHITMQLLMNNAI